jgi:hypothetical protein
VPLDVMNKMTVVASANAPKNSIFLRKARPSAPLSPPRPRVTMRDAASLSDQLHSDPRRRRQAVIATRLVQLWVSRTPLGNSAGVKGRPPEPWKWASKNQFRTVNTVSEKVIVMVTMAFGICAAIGVALAAAGHNAHHAHEHSIGLLVFGLGFAGALVTPAVGAIVQTRRRRRR